MSGTGSSGDGMGAETPGPDRITHQYTALVATLVLQLTTSTSTYNMWI